MARSSGHLGKKDRIRLEASLKGLPAELAYLRKPILAIADQNQDLLGCGEADIGELEKAVAERRRALPEHSPTDDAELLHEWLAQQEADASSWAGPAWFIEGCLRGFDMFAAAPAPVESRKRSASGLRRVEVDVPQGFRTKLYEGGMELGNREVQIIICELTDETYAIRREGYERSTEPSFLASIRATHQVCDELDRNFRIGSAEGLRLTSRRAQSGLIAMCQYLLSVAGAKVEIGMFARGQRRADLTKYESIVASIRCR